MQKYCLHFPLSWLLGNHCATKHLHNALAQCLINWGVTIWIFSQLMPLCCKANILIFPLSWLPGDHCAALPIVDRQCSSSKLGFANTLLLLAKTLFAFSIVLIDMFDANQSESLSVGLKAVIWLVESKEEGDIWLAERIQEVILIGWHQTNKTNMADNCQFLCKFCHTLWNFKVMWI